MKETAKARLSSQAKEEIELLIETTLKEKEVTRKDLLKHLDNCPLCGSVIIECPWCKASIPFSYKCPECKKTLPLETLISKLAEKTVEKLG